MPSASITRPTSSTVARIAACWASAPSLSGGSPFSCATLSSDAGNSAEHQPPLRPDAPNPATSASTTATFSEGSASAR